MTSLRLLTIVIAEAALILLGVYGYVAVYAPGQSVSSASYQPVTITGAGATLAYPLLTAVKSQYQATHPGFALNYQPVGSIAGLTLLMDKTLDFAATYPPIPKGQWKNFPSTPLHIPESISAVVVAYNVPGITSLRLTGNVTADIFRGAVTKWNDPEIQNLNSQTLPDEPINTWHMEEAEGTTYVFTNYLYSVSPAWRASNIGAGTTVNWAAAGQASGDSVVTDALVAQSMKQTQYSIGYMELSYAIQSSLPYAQIQNSYSGKWITPSVDSVQAALSQLTRNLPSSDQDWSSVSLLNEQDPNAYPLVTFTYLIVYSDLSVLSSMDLVKAKALVGFIWYLVHDGQSLGTSLGYAPLPANVVSIDETALKYSITFQSQNLL